MPARPRPIVFLDLDGVLITEWSLQQEKQLLDEFWRLLERAQARQYLTSIAIPDAYFGLFRCHPSRAPQPPLPVAVAQSTQERSPPIPEVKLYGITFRLPPRSPTE